MRTWGINFRLYNDHVDGPCRPKWMIDKVLQVERHPIQPPVTVPKLLKHPTLCYLLGQGGMDLGL